MLPSSENTCVVPLVANRSIKKDHVTPHNISVMILIKEQCEIQNKKENMRDKGKLDEEQEFLLSRQSKGFCIVVLKLMQSPDLNYVSLKKHIQAENGACDLSPDLVEKFFDGVRQIVDLGTDALLDLVSATSQLVSSGKTGCAKYSVLGLYLRRILLSFDKLTFPQVVNLLNDFKNYTAESPTNKKEGIMRWTAKEAELLIARETARLTRECPGPMHSKISSLLQSNSNFAEAHFLKFLNCLRCKEFCGAKESLHQCFDKAMSSCKVAASASSGTSPSNDEQTLRYSTLNLAAMHVSFGHMEEAKLALKEVNRLSHCAFDSTCLQHSLSWLYNTTVENREVLLHKAMARCSDLQLGYLMSLAIQAYSRHSGQTGGRPSAIFDVVMKSDTINHEQLLTELPANSFGLKAALWNLYGHSNLTSLYSQQLLHLRGILQPPTCLALCNIARFLADQGEYEHAMNILNEAQELFPRNDAWMITYQEVHYAHLLCQSRFHEALECATFLAPVKPRECALRKIWLSHLQGDNLRVITQTKKITDLCSDRWFVDPDLPPIRVRALMITASCLPPGEALWCLLKALTFAQVYFLHYLEAVVTMSLANVLLNLSMGQRALRLAELSLPYLMAHGGCQSRGRALITLARCRLAVHTTQDHHVRTAGILTTAQDWLLKAQDYVRVKHCWYLKAHIYHELGVIADRNKCAFEFRQLEEIYPTPPSFFTKF